MRIGFRQRQIQDPDSLGANSNMIFASHIGFPVEIMMYIMDNPIHSPLPKEQLSKNHGEIQNCFLDRLIQIRYNLYQAHDLSNNKIQGRTPDWVWSSCMSSLQRLNISHNMLTSVDSIPLQYVYIIDLRSNLLQGSLPIPPSTTEIFFISQIIRRIILDYLWGGPFIYLQFDSTANTSEECLFFFYEFKHELSIQTLRRKQKKNLKTERSNAEKRNMNRESIENFID
ncbi:hypothetical protein CQW23_28875 [Capsicum baccatum]|uniref:Uncharacterized protein n=1 Tax=Capsicum baccatum TaxID=33114 RepID=A0A2G2VHW3_CAPBA|nr:hypothetical protein CQW23_28875 [Capsicum baccatum]